MFKPKIEKLLAKAVVDLGFVKPTDMVLSISEKFQFGDYSSNIALQLSKQKHQNSYQNPKEIANALIEKLGHPVFLERIEVAGAGFINFFIKDSSLSLNLEPEDEGIEKESSNGEQKREIIVEYCDPNTHKMLHIGHLLQLTLGETMARLYEYQGHSVIRTNYGSDIGLTVGKCLWGVEKLKTEYEKAKTGSLREKAEFLGKAYAYGHGEYEKSIEVKEEIDNLTNRLYNNPFRSRSESEIIALTQGTLPSADAERQSDLDLFKLWKETKDWSLGYFETIYSIFGTLFDRRINESEVDSIGKEIVLANVGKVFVKDDGAIIFKGEKYGLHTRVFINGRGNPLYETKDVGLAEFYQQHYQFDQLNIFSHKEQDDYFKVIITANEILFPHLKGKIHHISYGEVKLSSGKMSSRTGNVIAAEDIFNQVSEKIRAIAPHLDSLSINALSVAAVKFAFLKYSPKSDIIYDLEESVSVHGDTGPYVVYVYARIMSLIKKAIGNRATDFEAEEEESEDQKAEIAQKGAPQPKRRSKSLPAIAIPETIEPEEREILRLLDYFELTVGKATENFQPNEITKYLLNLTKAFNSFYEAHSIIGSKSEEFRLALASRVAEQIKLGMYLLGIETVDRM